MTFFATIVNFIINLSLLLPGEAYIKTPNLNEETLYREIFEDFKVFGLILES